MTRARCGREDAHGGHWIGLQPSGGPFCVGNVAIVEAVTREEFAGQDTQDRCQYAGCLGPADGSECRHPDAPID